MYSKIRFLYLDKEKTNCFEELKTSKELAMHGPLKAGQEVPCHLHSEISLYLVTSGKAEFRGDKQKTLGTDLDFNAVLIPKNKVHGWCALEEATLIEHTFGVKNIDKILNAA